MVLLWGNRRWGIYMIRAAVLAAVLASSTVTVRAEWEIAKKKDPFMGQSMAEMMTLGEDGWGTIISVGCSTHGYLAITIMTRETIPAGFTGAKPISIDVKVDDTMFSTINAEVYRTQSSLIAVRTSKQSASDVRKILGALKGATNQIAVRASLLEGYAKGDVDGSTRAAETVEKTCGGL